MPFPYYERLSARDQATYRRSDGVTTLQLPEPGTLHPLVEDLRRALAVEERRSVEEAAGHLCLAVVRQLALPPVALEVLAVRPRSRGSELHGLYTRDERRPARIQVWMRTARQRRVVAFRTFLRTLLHEVCHHLDYEHLRLGESFHTEGFFRRESSLFHQLVPEGESPFRRPEQPPSPGGKRRGD
jgi:hypothetical protein